MPAQKRSLPESANDEDASPPSGHHNHHHHHHNHHQHAKQSRRDGDPEQDDRPAGEPQDGAAGGGGGGAGADEEEEDSQGSPSSSSEEKPEFVYVKLSDIRKDVQCPICLGIIRKTRTVMECLHRFCRECIDKSMRLGNNECPACRTHCASRRSLRDDPNFDALIAALYPDIDKYEEEELAFHEEERNRNKQIQASIAQILQRQSEALVKRRSLGKDAGIGMGRPQRNLRPSTRRRRNSRGTDHQGSEDNEDEHDSNGGKDSSSADERGTEVRQRRRRKRTGPRSSLPSSSADVECLDNDLEATRDTRGISPGPGWNPEVLAWGRGGTRSHTRHGGINGNNKHSKNMRLSKLVEYLKSLGENTELEVYFMLVSLDKESTPTLKQPYLCSRRSLSIKHLCDYVAHKTPLQAEEVEILVVKGNHNISRQGPSLNLLSSASERENVLPVVDPHKAELQILEKEATLAGIIADNGSINDYLILGYRQRQNSNS
ncbi:hypothetical protein ACJRO7_006845 [Eucalyptus globulus]|uniref:RING-type domain-containing protein n=1 Tax=Eucalyptus globulus TaxID=34317 RepID=A0ABD3ILW7_EUCGL